MPTPVAAAEIGQRIAQADAYLATRSGTVGYVLRWGRLLNQLARRH